MDTPTITQLRELRDNIRKSLRLIKVSQYAGQNFGNEGEYVAEGVVTGVEAILVDISALTKATAKFIQKSTHAERKQLVQHLTNLNTYVGNKDLKSIAITIDNIKPVLRNIGVRHTDERKDAFDEHINGLQKKASSIAQHINDVETIKTEGTELKEEIESLYQELTVRLEEINKKEKELSELIEEVSSNRSELESMLSVDQQRSEEIAELLSNSKSHDEVIETFSKKVSKRESQLEDQEVFTNDYKEQLSKFTEERNRLLVQAQDLIKSAKQALEYKTAEGLSAAFSEKYGEAKSDKSTGWWIFGATLFVVASMFIGIWVVTEKNITIETIVGRVSLLPILLAGAWFCAGQYVKLKNIAEDYAYKSVLTKSIVGFSEQLSTKDGNGEEYSHYIKSVLEQIHNDPLRKHATKDSGHGLSADMKEAVKDIKGLQSAVEAIEKIVKSIKT